MSEYLRLLSKILNEGEYRKTRNANTWSLFNEKLEFDLQGGNNFPLLTTKRMFLRGIFEELMFYLSGSTNNKILTNEIYNKYCLNIFEYNNINVNETYTEFLALLINILFIHIFKK